MLAKAVKALGMCPLPRARLSLTMLPRCSHNQESYARGLPMATPHPDLPLLLVGFQAQTRRRTNISIRCMTRFVACADKFRRTTARVAPRRKHPQAMTPKSCYEREVVKEIPGESEHYSHFHRSRAIILTAAFAAILKDHSEKQIWNI